MKVTKNKSGTYTCHIMLRDEEGKRHSKRFTAKTKREAQQAALDYQTEHTVYMTSTAFSDCMERYISQKAKVLSPSTIKAYRSIQREILKSYGKFASLPVDRITQSDVQALANDLRLTRKAKTVRNFLGLVSSVMGMENRRLRPADVKKDRQTFNPAVPNEGTVRAVMSEIVGTRLEAAFGLACLGLRRGEICGVRASDLDGCVLHVCRSIVLNSDNFLETKSTKTDASDRFILIPDRIADLIRDHGCAWNGTPNALSECFRYFLRSRNLPVFRLHDCRHFFASYCHDVMGLSDAQIMKLGGWSTPNVMKRVYITSITDESAAVKDAFSGIFATGAELVQKIGAGIGADESKTV